MRIEVKRFPLLPGMGIKLDFKMKFKTVFIFASLFFLLTFFEGSGGEVSTPQRHTDTGRNYPGYYCSGTPAGGYSIQVNGSEIKQKGSEEKFRKRRYAMVSSQIIARGVKDERVFESMRRVPRHLFVDESLMNDAYSDRPLPIGYGQTISQPYIVALMTELLQVDSGDVVLEVGTGSGYQAAVLAEIVSKVYTIEIIEALGKRAERRLENLGYKNIKVKIDDGYYGWPDYAPFDAIIVTAAAGHIPPPLIKQLKPGGRMAIPVGSIFFVQNLVLVKKNMKGEITTKNILPVRFVPLVGGH